MVRAAQATRERYMYLTMAHVITLEFVERRGGVLAEDMLSNHSLLKLSLKDLTYRLAAGAPPTKKSPLLYQVIVAAYELYVQDVSKPLYLRAYAFVKCLRVWATLRAT